MIVWNSAGLYHLLEAPGGAVMRDMIRRAIRVESAAKENASGRPGPNVQTGELRSSLHWWMVTGGVRVGSNIEYAGFVELGTSRAPAYPFLRPALPMALV